MARICKDEEHNLESLSRGRVMDKIVHKPHVLDPWFPVY